MNTNISLVHEDVLHEVEMITSRSKSINPLFLNDVSSLTEAMCLSDCVAWDYDYRNESSNMPHLLDGRLMPVLSEHGALDLYLGKEINSSRTNSEFEYFTYLEKWGWMPHSIVFMAAGDDLRELIGGISYLFPRFIKNVDIIDRQKSRTGETIFDDLRKHSDLSVPANDIYSQKEEDYIFDLLSSVEHKIIASQYLGDAIGATNYVTPSISRHSLINENYKLTDRCLEGLLNKIFEKNREIESGFHPANGFSHIIVPDFGRLLLSNISCPEDIPLALVRLRERFSELRKTCASYEKRKNEADSIHDLDKISSELEKAWTNLLQKQQASFSSRLTYSVWDVVKKGPKMIIEALDVLRRKDELNYPIFRVAGLYNAWEDFRKVTPSWKLSTVLKEKFGESINDDVFKSYSYYLNHCQQFISHDADCR